MRRIEWGWRVPCAEPGCRAVNEKWSTEGTPALGTGLKGWKVIWVTGKPRRSPNHSHRWYCPKHAGPVKKWQDDHSRWDRAKREVAKTTWRTFLPKWAEWPLELMGVRIKESVEEWMEKNPEPVPPWEVKA